jgi:hypothetical protein
MDLGRLKEGRRKNRGTVVQEMLHCKCKYMMAQKIISYELKGDSEKSVESS